MNEWILLAIGLVLTLGTGVFVASEFSLVALERAALERRRSAGERGLGSVLKALSTTSTQLSSAQLGITLTTLLAGFTLEPALSTMLNAPLGALGISDAVLPIITVPLAVAIATLLSMIFGELVPKNFAIAKPLETAKIVSPLQLGFTAVFKPAVLGLNGSANWFLRKVGIEPKEELSSARTAQELSSLVRHSANTGLLEEETADLIGRTLRFSERNAIDVMTPRLKMESLHKLDSAQSVIDLAGKTGFSRFPVIDEDRDDVVGVVHLKQAVGVPREKRQEVPVAALSDDAPRVPETMPLDVLLGELRNQGFQIAIVVDEYGGTSGMVTLEDLVEELIGEVADEHDRDSVEISQRGDHIEFPADLRPDEVLSQTSIVVPERPEYDTVAGYVVYELGRMPQQGDSVAVPEGTLTVQKMDGMRVDRLLFTRAAETGGGENDE
ncbi:hemolysin family protein [Leucobacter chinensis]|uniref:hemolysin family protein n=1 Tax=Leucobacter chinensis TaxID=2851010 RepID=UPI001C2221AA|nr:hemolysin family protein [Leucobacter chinensis]